MIGRPKPGRRTGRSLTALLRRRLAEVDPESGKTFGRLVVEGWIDAARKGNLSAVKEMLDRTEGKVPDKVRVGDPRKAYIIESPESLWPPDPNSDLTDPGAPPAPCGATIAPSWS